MHAKLVKLRTHGAALSAMMEQYVASHVTRRNVAEVDTHTYTSIVYSKIPVLASWPVRFLNYDKCARSTETVKNSFIGAARNTREA